MQINIKLFFECSTFTYNTLRLSNQNCHNNTKLSKTASLNLTVIIGFYIICIFDSLIILENKIPNHKFVQTGYVKVNI